MSVEFEDLLQEAVDQVPPVSVDVRAVKRLAVRRRRLGVAAVAAAAAATGVAASLLTLSWMTGPAPAHAPAVTVGSGSPSAPSGPGPSGSFCRPDQLRMTLTWRRTSTGLAGDLEVTNPGPQPCWLSGKHPSFQPLDPDGRPIPVALFETAEGGTPQIFGAGRRATEQLEWARWCGKAPGDQVLLTWPTGGSVRLTVAPPTNPGCGGAGGDLEMLMTSPLVVQ